MKDLCFIDIETTGAIFGYHEIIEVGIVRTNPHGKQIMEQFESKLYPKYPVSLDLKME